MLSLAEGDTKPMRTGGERYVPDEEDFFAEAVRQIGLHAKELERLARVPGSFDDKLKIVKAMKSHVLDAIKSGDKFAKQFKR